ncbi:MAG: lysophospholipid acyltransferase family protein, partial [Acidobacteria bacterium]|nr:lysophospholipid acyltransferase family protein [Acidobacteriota bacterium]
LSCHTGFWELLGVATARQGLPLFAVGRRPDEAVFGDLVRRVRAAVAAQNIERGTAEGRRLLRRALEGEGALTILIDQDTSVDGVWVPFFGQPAHTPVGAAEMALRHNMRVVPAFLERRAGGVHAARFLPALALPADATAATAVMTAAIEEHIRRHPEQWVWWHRRWRRQPEGD